MRLGAVVSGFERQSLNQMADANAAALTSAIRLATGNKINSPSDDPPGFLEVSSFERRLNVVSSTQKNLARASNVAVDWQRLADG